MLYRAARKKMTESYRVQLVHTLRTVLKPLVQILFRAGVRFDEFVELLRGIYAEITIRDALAAGKQISTGRISILSGVARRDIDRLVSSDDWLRAPKPTDTAALAAVLHRWHTDSAFLGPYGVPLELPLVGQAGRNFTELVGGAPIPIDPVYAYEQLLAANMIARSGETHVKVLSRTYVMPEPLSPAMLEHFGSAMTNLASTLNFNMTPDQKAKRLEQSVFPDDGLPEELMGEFDAFVRERARELISEVDDWLAAAAKRPISKPATYVTTGLSIFHYVSQQEQRLELDKQVHLAR
jgi:hypothetical protein